VRIIHRYIWKEFIQMFLICVMVFGVLGIGKIVFDYNDFLIGYRVTANLFGIIILNQLPTLVMDILPAASLCGVILSQGRLLREHELDVIRLNGVGVYQMMFPVFVGVLAICAGAFWWNDLVVPSANHRFQVEIKKLSMQQDMPLLKENVVVKGPQNRFVYLKKIERKAKQIEGIVILDNNNTGTGWPRLITAKKGKILGSTWRLNDGVIHELDDQGVVVAEVGYQKMSIKMSGDIMNMISDGKNPNEMRVSELKKRVEAEHLSGIDRSPYAVFYHQKFADPLISLVLVFLAIPLTMISSRNSRWTGLILCLLIILAYYALQVIGRTMGCNGILSPWIAAWAPHLVFITLGLCFLAQIERRR